MHARYLLDARDIVKARAQRHARSDCSSDVLFEAAIKDGLTTGERTNIHEAAIIASGFGDVNSLAKLLEKGANPNWAVPGERRTALHAAVIFSQVKAVSLLLRYGADPTISDNHGKSALDLSTEIAPNVLSDPIFVLLQSKVDEIATAGKPLQWRLPPIPSKTLANMSKQPQQQVHPWQAKVSATTRIGKTSRRTKDSHTIMKRNEELSSLIPNDQSNLDDKNVQKQCQQKEAKGVISAAAAAAPPQVEEHAASMKLQARQRGRMARQDMAEKQQEQQQNAAAAAASPLVNSIIDIGDSPEEHAASMKLQARQRGRMA